jgi:hypothetical protein
MKQIVSIVDPEIKIDDIGVIDVETGAGRDPSSGETKLSKLAGSRSPFIVINRMKFSENDVSYLNLSLSGFIPMLTVMLTGKMGLLNSTSFPKSGDVVSLYIYSGKKSIRQDYRIIKLTPSLDGGVSGTPSSVTITAKLNILELFNDRLEHYPNMSSYDTLIEICKSIKLGFASNDTMTNDTMTRICPFTSFEDFILNDVVNNSYKDDSSFFMAFVDQFYYLNFIQVNDMIVNNEEILNVNIESFIDENYNSDSTEIKSFERLLMLTNSKIYAGTSNHIINFSIVNNSGQIDLKNGYRNYIQYYDKINKSFTEYFLDTLNTDGSDNKIILKGRIDEDYTLHRKIEHFGIQNNDNVHDNYYYAKMQNKINLNELNKFGIICDMIGINPHIIKGMIIPIVIITSNSDDIKNMSVPKGEEGETRIDKFISGYYTVMDINYTFQDDGYKTNIFAIKRELDTNQ